MYFDKIDITKKLADGHLDALKVIHDHYHSRFVNIAINFLKSRVDAEEVVQDTFLKLWNYRFKLQVEKSYEGYLYTIFKNQVYNKFRELSKGVKFTEITENVASAERPDDGLRVQDLETAYQLALDSLPPQRKQIFLLRKVQGLTNKEVGEELGVSVKMVEKQMTQAYKTLRTKLNFQTDIASLLIITISHFF